MLLGAHVDVILAPILELLVLASQLGSWGLFGENSHPNYKDTEFRAIQLIFNIIMCCKYKHTDCGNSDFIMYPFQMELQCIFKVQIGTKQINLKLINFS